MKTEIMKTDNPIRFRQWSDVGRWNACLMRTWRRLRRDGIVIPLQSLPIGYYAPKLSCVEVKGQ